MRLPLEIGSKELLGEPPGEAPGEGPLYGVPPAGGAPRRPRDRFLIIHNALAGMRRRWLLEQVCNALEAAGSRLSIVAADSAEADRRLAERAVAAGAWDAVVAAGGDSTVRGVACGLHGSGLPLGIIPLGTGNVLAHEIRFRSGPRAIAHNLRYGPALPILGGRANGTPFLVMAGAGFDARVLARLDTAWKRRLGKLAYVLPLATELACSHRPFEVVIDGRLHRCTWLIVAKASRYGGPFLLTRRQALAGAGFHAVVVRAQSRLSLAGVLLAIAAGRVEGHPEVELVPCSRVSVPHEPGVSTQLDGEVFGATPLEIAPAEEPLYIIVPALRQGGDGFGRGREPAPQRACISPESISRR